MRYFLFFLFSMILQNVQAQFVHEKSLELLLYDHGSGYGVVPAGEHGIVIFMEVKNTESTLKRKWDIIQVDKNLDLQWRSYFQSAYNYVMSQVHYADGYLYLMFEDSNVPAKTVLFARAGIHDQEFEFFEIKEFLPREVIGFEILGNSLFLIGMDEKGPAILKFSYGDQRPTVLRGLYNENNDLLNVEVVPNHNLIQIISRLKRKSGGNHVLLIKQFDESGEIHKDFMIESNKGHNLLDAKATTDEEGNICVVGTYAYGNSKLSSGIFSMVYDSEEEQSVYYYDYVNLHNFFSYLPEKEQDKIERKYKGEDKANNQSKYKINHQPREIVKAGDQWIYLGETVKFIEKNSRIYGSMWPKEYRKYANSLMLGIAVNGKLQWDSSMSLNDLTTPSSRQQVFMNSYGAHSIVYYLHGFDLVYSVFDDDESVLEHGNFEVTLPNITKARFEQRYFGEIRPWYQDTFLTFGSCLVDEAIGEGNNYFYINKISISQSDEQNK